MNSIKHILRIHQNREYVEVLSDEPSVVNPPHKVLEYIRKQFSHYYNCVNRIYQIPAIYELQVSEVFQFIKGEEVKSVTMPSKDGFKEEELDDLLEKAEQYVDWIFK